MIHIHYALQTYDRSNNQSGQRFCADTKAEVTQKCVTSFFESVAHAASQQLDSKHTICVFDDGSTPETIAVLDKLAQKYAGPQIAVRLEQRSGMGVMGSIRACWEWLAQEGKDLVYQVQDDYLYEPAAIWEMISMFVQLNTDVDTQAIIVPYNDPYHWIQGSYRYTPTPRTIIPGIRRYWLQIYDIPCTFMTSHTQFQQHWPIYEQFLGLGPTNPKLEAISLNYILTRRGVLGVAPVTSVALHMQGERERDPYIDWRKLWDSIVVDRESML
jgi:hypothetical protein